MILLILGFGMVLGYQIYLLRRGSAGRRERAVAFSVTGAVFAYAAFAFYFPEWANPHKAIQFVFEPLQSLIVRD